MKRVKKLMVVSVLALAFGGADVALASGIPVVDVAAISNQLIQIQHAVSTITQLTNQLQTMKNQLAAIKGARGMGQLLAGEVRNYLPDDLSKSMSELQSLSNSAQQLNSQVGQIGQQMKQITAGNAILTDDQMKNLPAAAQQVLMRARNAAAMQKAIADTSFTAASARVKSLQQLISAIDGATDIKAINDLQARIQAEQTMLQNDAIKLSQAAELSKAEDRLIQQQREEIHVNMWGSAGNAKITR